jgi:hypothetical protein
MQMLYRFAGVILAAGVMPCAASAQENLSQLSDGQTASLSAPGEVTIEQIGTENIAEVTSDSNSSLVVDQQGNEQAAYVRLSGAANQGDVVQRGDRNSAEVLISGSVNAFSVTQNSAAEGRIGNEAVLEQLGLANSAFQTQIGRGNSMTLRQTGDANFADLLQDGNNNEMELNQNGNENNATLMQYGDSAPPIIITQTGDMGSVTITQYGE